MILPCVRVRKTLRFVRAVARLTLPITLNTFDTELETDILRKREMLETDRFVLANQEQLVGLFARKPWRVRPGRCLLIRSNPVLISGNHVVFSRTKIVAKAFCRVPASCQSASSSSELVFVFR